MTFAQRVKIENKFGICCNSCLHFDKNIYDVDEPCFICSNAGKWESCRTSAVATFETKRINL